MFNPFRNSEAYREIFQSMSEGITLIDELRFIVAANPVSDQILHYEKGTFSVNRWEVCPNLIGCHHINFRETFNQRPVPRRGQESTFSFALPLT